MKKIPALFVCLALLAGLFAGCGGGTSSSASGGTSSTGGGDTSSATGGGELNLYTWEGMFPQEVLTAFTEETGIKVNYSSFDTDETMLAKLETAKGGDYDVVIADDYIIETAIAENLVAKLDKSKLSNFGNINPAFQGQFYDPENEYTVPYGSGVQTIVYDPAQVSKEITSYADLWDASLAGSVGITSNFRVMNGMALHGGVIPVCGTFFVFSDYMKPAVRLSALMRLHVIYIWTHDSFRVGEDGPTHQPIEHEAQIRLMEHLRNHAGERSMVVLRPADAEETLVAWKVALEEHRPVALVLSRQNIKSLPTLGRTRREEAAQAAKGGYAVVDAARPAAVLVATGSEVATLVEGAGLLAEEGIAVRVVSVPSEGLFRDQPRSYRESVLPAGTVRYGMTSGLPVNLLGLVGESGFIHGLDHFGYSAPYKVLDEKFGYNGRTVAEEVKKLLGR